jgi:hypothetical protein
MLREIGAREAVDVAREMGTLFFEPIPVLWPVELRREEISEFDRFNDFPPLEATTDSSLSFADTELEMDVDVDVEDEDVALAAKASAAATAAATADAGSGINGLLTTTLTGFLKVASREAVDSPSVAVTVPSCILPTSIFAFFF